MNSVRQKIIEEKIEGLDEETKNIYRIAELICRREYEKAFDLDLNLPLGHPNNLITFTDKILLKKIDVWESLKEKYFDKVEDPLASAVSYFCDMQATGIINLLRNSV